MKRATAKPSRRVRVHRVVDGDSLEVKYSGFFSFLRRPFAVRLYAIDAPELAQPYGAEARNELASLVGRGGIRMEEVATDRYGRRVGLLYRSRRGRQQSINLMMVRSGMAYWYQRYGGQDLGFPGAEEDARRQRLGVWRDQRREPAALGFPRRPAPGWRSQPSDAPDPPRLDVAVGHHRRSGGNNPVVVRPFWLTNPDRWCRTTPDGAATAPAAGPPNSSTAPPARTARR